MAQGVQGEAGGGKLHLAKFPFFGTLAQKARAQKTL